MTSNSPWSPRAPGYVLALLCLYGPFGVAFDKIAYDSLTLEPSFLARLGVQRGNGIHYGYGASDSVGETERSTLYVVLKPRLNLELDLPAHAALGSSSLYGGVSFVAGATTLDGEISGQVARGGDEAFDTDHAYFGWRNDVLDVSVGGQDFAVADGFVIGDGNFNMGGENGQYWTGGFSAWRNSAILRLNTKPLRADAFWLRSDEDFAARVVGANIENSVGDFGTIGVMYLEVLEAGAFNYDGINAWDIHAQGIKLPRLPQLEFFAEWVMQLGTDKQGRSQDNQAIGWWLEGQYTFVDWAWLPRLSYRYVRLSGDDLDTLDNEEYRGLFFTIFKRDWDTWYQGEIAGEYHLFNQNQITQLVKLRATPHPQWALSLKYFHHALEEPHYFATRVSDTNWADEINVGVEHFRGERFYGYAGIAWSTPNRAAEEVFGNDNFYVVQTFLQFQY